jgi:hypothetical protein
MTARPDAPTGWYQEDVKELRFPLRRSSKNILNISSVSMQSWNDEGYILCSQVFLRSIHRERGRSGVPG